MALRVLFVPGRSPGFTMARPSSSSQTVGVLFLLIAYTAAGKGCSWVSGRGVTSQGTHSRADQSLAGWVTRNYLGVSKKFWLCLRCVGSVQYIDRNVYVCMMNQHKSWVSSHDPECVCVCGVGVCFPRTSAFNFPTALVTLDIPSESLKRSFFPSSITFISQLVTSLFRLCHRLLRQSLPKMCPALCECVDEGLSCALNCHHAANMAKAQEAWSINSAYIMQQACALTTSQSVLSHAVKNMYILIFTCIQDFNVNVKFTLNKKRCVSKCNNFSWTYWGKPNTLNLKYHWMCEEPLSNSG